MALSESAPRGLAPAAPADLRSHTIRGGAVTIGAQALKVLLNLCSTMILARLLTPVDYGLIAMVTAFTSFVEILKDGGLSLATVQCESITEEQVSTLFWLNVGLGTALTLLTLSVAPLIAHFYSEPRLTPVVLALAGTFLLSGFTVQHQALLRRKLRFTILAFIDVLSIVAGLVVAVVMADLGCRYWALVGMTVGTTLTNAIAVWLAEPWRPGQLHLDAGIRPMIGFGGNIIATRFVHSFIRHSPNILLGWYWGPVAVGIYQRAYALLMFAVDQIQGPIAAVTLGPLCRLQKDPGQQKQFFLGGYGVIAAAIVPVVVTCAVFAEEIVYTLLGPQWSETAVVFRWLALSGVFIGLIHPQGLLLIAMGRAGKCMKIVLADATCMVLAYIAGLRFGAAGIALSFLVAKILICVPLTFGTFHGTAVTGRDVLGVVKAPLLAAALAAALGLAVKHALAHAFGPRPLAIAGTMLMLAVYGVALLTGTGRWSYYRSLLDELRSRKPLDQPM